MIETCGNYKEPALLRTLNALLEKEQDRKIRRKGCLRRRHLDGPMRMSTKDADFCFSKQFPSETMPDRGGTQQSGVKNESSSNS